MDVKKIAKKECACLCNAKTRKERLALLQQWLSLYGTDFIAEALCHFRKQNKE